MLIFKKNKQLVELINFILTRKKVNQDFFQNLDKDDKFWQNSVGFLSSHLLLPLFYHKLNEKKSIIKPPEDLMIYLKKIYNYNFSRNRQILKQVSAIAELFNKNKIKYVFLKGSALMIKYRSYYPNIRMIGDIDILIDRNNIYTAEKLLKEAGYKEDINDKPIFSTGLILKRHMPRLNHKEYIASVELHVELLDQKYVSKLQSYKLLKQKEIVRGLPIPSKLCLWEHSVLNWQLNDRGLWSNTLSFRSVFDTLFLEPNNVNNILRNKPKEFKKYYSLISLYVNKYTTFFPINKNLYFMQMNNKFFSKFIVIFNIITEVIELFSERFILFIKYSEYRKKILKNPGLLFRVAKKYFKKI